MDGPIQQAIHNSQRELVVRIVCHLEILLLCVLWSGCSVSSEKPVAVQYYMQPDLEIGRGSLHDSQLKSPVSISREAPLIETEIVPANATSFSEEPQSTVIDAGLEATAETNPFPELISGPSEPTLLNSQPAVLQVPTGDNQLPVELPLPADAEELAPAPQSSTVLQLEDVIDSVYTSYPLLTVAFLSQTVADGDLLSTNGAFDLKLKGGGTSGPLGFYKTNRFGAGVSQPLFSGGELFGGYKVGRGNFQPWFKERQTDDGGEFSVGIAIPLSQNRQIDARRAALYRATYGREAVQPNIQSQLVEFVWESSYAYWKWVAAGRNYQIAESLLEIAQQRNDGLSMRVEEGDLAPIALTDNQRLIVSRQASLIDARRKLQQAAIKLSLFLRTPDGQPIIPSEDQLPAGFPEATSVNPEQMHNDIQLAMANRPELVSLELLKKQLDVDLTQARNLYLPEVNAMLFASKDTGAAASSLGDKTPFELEASLQLSVPLQRRKALGKIQAIEGKLSQLSVKIGFTQDKIATDVQGVYAAMLAAYERITKARESLEYARTMEQAERRKFELGDSDLLLINLREKATADAAKTVLQAMLDYYQAQADYRAAMALDVNPEGSQSE